MTGSPVDLVLYGGGHTQLLQAELLEAEPLRLRYVGSFGQRIQPMQQVMLLACYDGMRMRSAGVLDRVHEHDGVFDLNVSDAVWELLERRRHIRMPVRLPVKLRAVDQGGADLFGPSIDGATFDLSVSGAFIHVNEMPREDALLEVEMQIEGTLIRTLAVVARLNVDRGGMGLHFVEYLDDALGTLTCFLENAA